MTDVCSRLGRNVYNKGIQSCVATVSIRLLQPFKCHNFETIEIPKKSTVTLGAKLRHLYVIYMLT